MTDRQADYYRIAYQCQKNFKISRCTHCNSCPFNVSLLLKDQQEAMMLKTHAAMRVHTESVEQTYSIMGTIFIVLLLGLGILWLNSKCSAQKMPVQVAQEPAQLVDQSNYPQDVVEIINKLDYLDSLGLIIDVNDDGKLNCIDWTMMFMLGYEGPGNPRVIVNYNPPTMNHMFILLDNQFIEPQGDNKGRIYMRDIWGNKFNPTYNEDQTVKRLRDMRLVLIAKRYEMLAGEISTLFADNPKPTYTQEQIDLVEELADGLSAKIEFAERHPIQVK